MHAENPPIIRKSRLIADLHGLGVQAGQTVMLHVSVKAIGWIVGGPDVVLDALLEVLGPSGTLMMVAGSEDSGYGIYEWDEAKRQAYLEELPPFDITRTRAYRKWSILTEYLRTRPGTVRSRHPDCSFVARGAKAAFLMADQPLSYSLGPGSPLDKLVQCDGEVLLLGSAVSDVTLLHYAEYLLEIPNKKAVRYRTPMLVDGRTEWVEIEELDGNNGIADFGVFDYFTPITTSYLAARLGRSGKVGAADAHLLSAPEFLRHAVTCMQREYRGEWVDHQAKWRARKS